MVDEPKPPLVEPIFCPCLFTTGFEIEVAMHVVRLIAWVTVPPLGADQPERRVVARLVMPDVVARQLDRDLRSALSRKGN